MVPCRFYSVTKEKEKNKYPIHNLDVSPETAILILRTKETKRYGGRFKAGQYLPGMLEETFLFEALCQIKRGLGWPTSSRGSWTHTLTDQENDIACLSRMYAEPSLPETL